MSSATTDAPIKADPIASFTMLRGPLVGMASLQSGDETRDVLCATHISLRGALGGQIILHATDGRIAARMTTYLIEEELFAPLPEQEDLLVDLSGVKDLPKVPRRGAQVHVEVFPAHVEIAAGSLRYIAKRKEKDEDAKPFPLEATDYILTAADREPIPGVIAVNGELMTKVLKAAEHCADDAIGEIAKAGKSTAIITARTVQFVAALALLKSDDEEEEVTK